MNYLTINIALILVSGTILHFLLFKKSLRRMPKTYFLPAQHHKTKVAEIVSIISVLSIVLLVGRLSLANSFFLLASMGVVLLLIFRMVRTNDR